VSCLVVGAAGMGAALTSAVGGAGAAVAATVAAFV